MSSFSTSVVGEKEDLDGRAVDKRQIICGSIQIRLDCSARRTNQNLNIFFDHQFFSEEWRLYRDQWNPMSCNMRSYANVWSSERNSSDRNIPGNFSICSGLLPSKTHAGSIESKQSDLTFEIESHRHDKEKKSFEYHLFICKRIFRCLSKY